MLINIHCHSRDWRDLDTSITDDMWQVRIR